MNILIDTNVVLNILLKQPPFCTGSTMIFYLAEEGRFTGYISASAITDIFYVAQKQLGKGPTKEAIKKILQVFHPATVTDSHIFQALDLDWSDFEDSVQFVVGEGLYVDFIITRNTQDFSFGSITAVTPEQFLEAITG